MCAYTGHPLKSIVLAGPGEGTPLEESSKVGTINYVLWRGVVRLIVTIIRTLIF